MFMHSRKSMSTPSRRSLLRAGAAITAAGAIARIPSRTAFAAQQSFGSPEYDAALAASGGVKGVFQSPHFDATIVAGTNLNHLLLLQLKNWLNGFQFAYQMDPGDLHTVSATYASANLLTYGDAVWAKYKLGEKYAITDPATGQPAVVNPFWSSRFGLDAPKDINAPSNYYQDTGIEVLQQRGTVF